MPGLDRQTRAAADCELLARRAAYQRETAWAPPYVAGELREAYLAEDAYRADAVLAWHRGEAARNWAGKSLACQQAQELSALAQQVRAHREKLEQIAEARRAWYQATEDTRQRALAADTELRRRHPGIDLPPLHPEKEHETGIAALAALPEPGTGQMPAPRPDHARLDIEAALDAARRARLIIAERQRQAREEAALESDDVIRRREAEALRQAEARRGAVRQEPVPISRAGRPARLADLEPEAGG
jgi:hypothetical protein